MRYDSFPEENTEPFISRRLKGLNTRNTENPGIQCSLRSMMSIRRSSSQAKTSRPSLTTPISVLRPQIAPFPNQSPPSLQPHSLLKPQASHPPPATKKAGANHNHALAIMFTIPKRSDIRSWSPNFLATRRALCRAGRSIAFGYSRNSGRLPNLASGDLEIRSTDVVPTMGTPAGE